MVNYHVVHLKVSPAQGKKMLQGESVRFKLSDMENGDVPVPVLKSHISRMMKAYKSGKGFVLQPLSASHRRYMIDGKHGDGFFSDLWSGIKSIGKKIIDNLFPPRLDSLARGPESFSRHHHREDAYRGVGIGGEERLPTFFDSAVDGLS